MSTPLRYQKTEFAERLRDAGIRATPQRIEIIMEVVRSENHPDAETVFRAIRRRYPSISLDTVYRNLRLFVDLGLISTLGIAKDRVRFDANLCHHHHFVCTRCGSVRDFNCAEFDELHVPESVRAMGKVSNAQVELRGICSACAGNNNKGS